MCKQILIKFSESVLCVQHRHNTILFTGYLMYRKMQRRRQIKSVDRREAVPSQTGWTERLLHHDALPSYLRDNEYLHKHHRPQLNSFTECFKSIFRIHTETGNIWTHLVGKCIIPCDLLLSTCASLLKGVSRSPFVIYLRLP